MIAFVYEKTDVAEYIVGAEGKLQPGSIHQRHCDPLLLHLVSHFIIPNDSSIIKKNFLCCLLHTYGFPRIENNSKLINKSTEGVENNKYDENVLKIL